MYLWKRGDIYWFRRAIPLDLKARAGSNDATVSLRTGDRRQARKRAMRLAVAMDEWSEAVRRAQEDDPEQPDRALLLRMLDDAMDLAERERATAQTRRQADAMQAAVREYKATVKTREHISGITKRITAISDRVATLATAPAKARSSEIADLRADFMNEIAKVRDDVQNVHKNQWSADLLSSKVDGYVKAKAKELGSTKHVSTIGPRIRNFLETIGDKPLRDYTRQDFERYRDILDRTPKRAFDRFKTNNLADAAEKNERRAQPFEVIDDKTVDDDYLTPIKTFFTYLVQHLWIPANPAVCVVSSRTRETRRTERPDEARRAFKSEQINAYFQYVVRRRSRATEDYWLPILALYTGARLNELCQIEPRRIIMHNGRWHIDLLTIYDPNEIESAVKNLQGAEKVKARLKLKTASARRQIPIHDDLIKIGFVEFVDQRRNHTKYLRLFPSLQPDQYGYYSSAVGKRLNRDIKRAGAKAADTSFYSFRHSFSSALERALVPSRTKDRIMGHLVAGAQGHYMEPELEAVETAVIERVTFPGVDISPYLPRKR
ncbi:site-specific integrase [Rhodopseudomonas palustris]|uniref:Site-specific integrase n=1 Tax=Rhodopseudomonas palustris TaxID=1076 RepID=A0AAX3DRF8_RHOPL|nr:site-specific integrase [Rhodopseudomonas palustris]UYO37481.1 site-specific integrase [Rhodopseudomonas palustris]